MLIMEYIKRLKRLHACDKAIKNARKYKTSQELWDDCNRGDWMILLIGKLSGEVGNEKRKQLVLTTCKCARLSLKYIKKSGLRPLKAIETAEAWAQNDKGGFIQDVKEAAYSIDAAYATAYAAAHAAAYAAHATAYASAYAAYATDATACAAAGAAAVATATAKNILAQCADIVRKDYPDIEELLKQN